MEFNEINILIDRYFEGKTTLEEERTIATYLATTETLSDEHIALKAMFEGMGLLREIKAPAPRTRRRGLSLPQYGGIAAAVACILISAVISTSRVSTTPIYNEPEIVCYVNGSMVDDPQEAEMEARRILGNMNHNINLAMTRIDKVNILKTK